MNLKDVVGLKILMQMNEKACRYKNPLENKNLSCSIRRVGTRYLIEVTSLIFSSLHCTDKCCSFYVIKVHTLGVIGVAQLVKVLAAKPDNRVQLLEHTHM